MKPLTVILILLFVHLAGYASIDSLWSAYKVGQNKEEISGLIFNYYKETRNFKKRDSTLQYMLQTEFDGDYSTRNALYKQYFECDDFEDNDFTVEQANTWVRINLEKRGIDNICKAFNNEFKILFISNQFDKAFESVEKCSYYANLSDNRVYKIITLLNEGKCFEIQNRKNEAYRNYLDAYYFSLEEKNKEYIRESLNTITIFFAANQRYSKAIEYKQKEISFYLKNYQPIDSSTYYNLLSDLSDNCFDNSELNNATTYSEMVIEYCLRKTDFRLLKKQITILRSNYFEHNLLDNLYALYAIKFPSLLDSLKKDDKIVYYRILSLFSEHNHQIKEATSYIDSAERFVNRPEESIYTKCNFYNRKAEYFMRQGAYQEAVMSLQIAFQYADSVKYIPFMMAISKNFDDAYTQLGDFKKAYFWRSLKDSIASNNNNDEIVLLEVENVEKQKELFQKQLEVNTVRKHNLQYMFIVILIAFSFIVLLIAGSFKIHRFIIKALGFFVFIFLFEFIILLADHRIEHLTHGEPLKIMGLKIILIAFLFPLHHWVEEKVVHYLLHHRIIDNVKFREAIRLCIARVRKLIQSPEIESTKKEE